MQRTTRNIEHLVGNNQKLVTQEARLRSAPASVEAERAILGALLLSDDAIHKVSEIIQPSDFFTQANKVVFAAMLELVTQRKRIDLVTLQDLLLARGELEPIGGTSYLVGLQEELPIAGLVEQHAQLVKEKSVLRELIGSADTIIANCYLQDQKGIDAVLDDAEKTIFAIANKRMRNNFVQIDIWLRKTFQHLSSLKNNGKGVTGVPTTFKKLDQMTSGLQNGDLIVLAARPSMGKTALSLGIAANAAARGVSVGIFSLEMSAEQLTLRLLSSESGIPHHSIRNATISSQEWLELTSVAAKLAEMPIFIDDTAMLDIMELRAKARKLKVDHQVQFIVIDYLQLIGSSSKRYENRHQEVSEISRSLKALAKELNVPILALSQLSRAVDGRVDKRPILSDLRESGAIEQDADLIMFLYRDIVYDKNSPTPTKTELIVGKQRNGPTGTVFLDFLKELTRFVDGDYESPEY